MTLKTQYNQKSPAVKRLMREACELAEATDEYHASPLEDNLFEWHFTVRGPPGTEFEGGIYHGRILLPTQYPMQPPNIIILTPNGRFEINKSICLSISGHHPETWQPSWSIRTALLALISFMPTPSGGTIGSLDYTPEERRVLAAKSRSWECPTCGKLSEKLSSSSSSSSGGAKALSQEETELISQISLKAEEESAKSSQEAETGGLRQRLPAGQGPVGEESPAEMEVETCSDKAMRIAAVVIAGMIALLILRRIFIAV